MQVCINFNNQNLILDVNIYDTIEKCKKKIQNMVGIPYQKQRLIYAGVQLLDNETLCQQKIQNKSTLYLFQEIIGGGFSFYDIEKVEEYKCGKYKEEYKHLCIIDGLNFQAYCQVCNCDVVIQLGFKKQKEQFFDIGRIKGKQCCPKCKKNIKAFNVKNLIFSNCFWKYEAMLFDSTKKIGYGKQYDNGNYATLSDKDEDIRSYEYLLIKVLPQNQQNAKELESYQFPQD
ncbi:hypothetical protein PPERSA_05339 [Pseudocohnilembus persalinus]|uniref:Ubiquitin-like domain-containing protein n=1 Tax=Pseudocohnilembus persalinus TaxID=266149 RepID=A0A0V0R650_PSEPJ|nr:hypothetical protein PPERSA_05339 [Pseudocohnilembus persalinus]|eukprot:KRX09947.1 hypothetical protein PPERSA_05339 [Pseudocohnilembus persalinus]